MTPMLASKMPWLTRERQTWLVVAALCGVIGFGIGNGHTTQNAIEHISLQYGSADHLAQEAIKAARCEHYRADVATAVASDPNGDTTEIPADCPHIPKMKVK